MYFYFAIQLLAFIVAVFLVYKLVKWITKEVCISSERFNFMLFRSFLVKKHEKALLFKERDFVEILSPGKYWKFDPLKKYTIETYDLSSNCILKGKNYELILKTYSQLVEEHFITVELSDTEVGLVYYNGVLKEILPPATRQAYWKGLIDIRIDLINIQKEAALPEDKKNIIVHLPGTYNNILLQEIKDYQVGILYENARFVKLLETGVYAYWKFNRFLEIKTLDLRLQSLEINGQEIMTKDKVTLRTNLTANFKVQDPLLVTKELPDMNDYIYKELQFTLREVIGTNTLDELLTQKDDINKAVLEKTTNKLLGVGIDLKDIGIKDIILPGDMRNLMNEVVAAEKQAQANLIKRREETAATRSQMNTAKMMENNPTLLRLKELETLERITNKIDKLTVFGGLDGLLEELTQLKR